MIGWLIALNGSALARSSIDQFSRVDQVISAMIAWSRQPAEHGHGKAAPLEPKPVTQKLRAHHLAEVGSEGSRHQAPIAALQGESAPTPVDSSSITL